VRAWGPGVLFAIALTSASASAAPIAVRHAESATHGFLVLRGANGDVLAHGEFVQAPVKGQRMESRLVFRFKDGSLLDETVTFTQQKVFRLMSYHHIERGPSFRAPPPPATCWPSRRSRTASTRRCAPRARIASWSVTSPARRRAIS
jgi:hypothetical protein